MIKLDISDYCETCPYFESETRQGIAYTDETTMCLGDTMISCKNAKICQHLAKQLSPEPSKLKDAPDWIYESPYNIGTNTAKKIEEIEKALGFKLFVWQKYYMLDGKYRMSGLTTADILRELMFDGIKPIDFTRPPKSHRDSDRRNTLVAIKKKLDAAGVKTREIIFR